jgi:hypothetical protein
VGFLKAGEQYINRLNGLKGLQWELFIPTTKVVGEIQMS